MQESPTQYRGWLRCPGSVLWHADKLPYWCITSAWTQDRHGVYYRQYVAMYHGQAVHEIQRS